MKIIKLETFTKPYVSFVKLTIEDGTYGACNDCNQLISKERLNEVHHATKCFDCKTSVV